MSSRLLLNGVVFFVTCLQTPDAEPFAEAAVTSGADDDERRRPPDGRRLVEGGSLEDDASLSVRLRRAFLVAPGHEAPLSKNALSALAAAVDAAHRSGDRTSMLTSGFQLIRAYMRSSDPTDLADALDSSCSIVEILVGALGTLQQLVPAAAEPADPDSDAFKLRQERLTVQTTLIQVLCNTSTFGSSGRTARKVCDCVRISLPLLPSSRCVPP